jgi:DNA-binding NtrC family response regulator
LTRRRILVVDDDPDLVDYLRDMLSDAGYDVEGTTDPLAAVERVRTEAFDLVVSDVRMPVMTGTELMERLHELRPHLLVLLVTAFGSVDLAVRALRRGACDFVTKPFRIEALVQAIERSLREREMRREIVRLRSRVSGLDTGDLIARSPSMQRVVQVVTRAARGGAPVLLTGDSGVGKGAVARFLHDRSERADGPFVQVNCAALPATLAESELFGVRRGAFTDARESRTGLFQRADGGTLFLDEVGEAPLELQPKLLHVLETGRVRPVGDVAEVQVDVRIVAATNRPLELALRENRFRTDLYYRLNVIRVEIPPLRDRPEDIDALVDRFLHRACERHGRPLVGISSAAMRWLLSHPWPGNVRELANTIERAVALSDHDTVGVDDLRDPAPAGSGGDFLDDAIVREAPLVAVEREYIVRMIRARHGNKTEAARALGIDRRTLYRRLADEPDAADGEVEVDDADRR